MLGALEGEAGYSVSASGALALRVGAFTSDFWEFPRGVASAATGQQSPPIAGVPRWDVTAFALLRPRVVAYNALTQGQFRDSPYTVRSRPLLGEWEGGVGLSIPMRTFQLQAVVQLAQGRTADFDRPKARAYTWGTVKCTDHLAGRHQRVVVDRTPRIGRRAAGAVLSALPLLDARARG